MIKSVALLNYIANLPDVLAGLAPGYTSIDLSPFFTNPKNVMLGDTYGCAIFAHRDTEPGVYEGHYMFPEDTRIARGWATGSMCRRFLHTMFTEHGAQAIWGFTPTENAAARALSRHLGFAPRGPSLLPSGRPCVMYVLERGSWAKLSGESSAV